MVTAGDLEREERASGINLTIRNCRFLIMFDLQEKGKFICFNLVYFLSAGVRKPKGLWESHCRGGALWSCSSVLLPGGGPSAALAASQAKDSWA